MGAKSEEVFGDVWMGWGECGPNVLQHYQSGVRVIQCCGKRVRIATPNCGNSEVVMWVICEVWIKEPMIKFVFSRGDSLRPACHGLIGRFYA